MEDQEAKSNNETSSGESGIPDSHELMNNRELHPKIREKRSYEFLMGLINNNSRYEVTKVDPEQSKVATDDISSASELLLELIVRIAAHPDQWDKVHKLLRTIDHDLATSRDVLSKLQATPTYQPSNFAEGNRNISIIKKGREPEVKTHLEELDNSKNSTSSDNTVSNSSSQIEQRNEVRWPTFGENEDSVKFINSSTNVAESNNGVEKYSAKLQDNSDKMTYPKSFTYHRVTGKPFNLNNSPKAYIAVSVIAPQVINSENEDDIELENELHQLKPGTHLQNLKNMESARTKK